MRSALSCTSLPPSFRLIFNNSVTTAQVETLVHSLTYLDDDGEFIEGRDISVRITDIDGRDSTSIVHVAGTEVAPGASPTAITISDTSVVENAGKDTFIGFLSGTDATPRPTPYLHAARRCGWALLRVGQPAAGEERRTARLRDGAEPHHQGSR